MLKFWKSQTFHMRRSLSTNNLKIVVDNGYEFIVGERLHTLPKHVKSYLIDINNYHKEWRYIDSLGKEVLVQFCTTKYNGRINRNILTKTSKKRLS